MNDNIQKIKDILIEFFTEERVDIKYLGHKYEVLIYFPEIKVTNENNKSITIFDTFVKFDLLDSGLLVTGNFFIGRSSYTILQYINRYIHSHVTGNLKEFHIPCYGTGPIKSTLLNLSINYDEDLWKLFCVELQKYLETESLAGIPYRRLESLVWSNAVKLSSYQSAQRIPNQYEDTIDDFIIYFIKNYPFKLAYNNKYYTLGISKEEFSINISKAFYEYYKENINLSLYIPCMIDNNIIYLYSSNSVSEDFFLEDSILCTFKGREIPITIKTEKDTPVKYYILHPAFIKTLLQYILFKINYYAAK